MKLIKISDRVYLNPELVTSVNGDREGVSCTITLSSDHIKVQKTLEEVIALLTTKTKEAK